MSGRSKRAGHYSCVREVGAAGLQPTACFHAVPVADNFVKNTALAL